MRKRLKKLAEILDQDDVSGRGPAVYSDFALAREGETG
jgi:hypothetical protein